MTAKGKEPTMADRLYRLTFSKHWDKNMWAQDRLVIRNAVQQARKFVLDDRMSSFLAELSTSAFAPRGMVVNTPHSVNLIEQMRTSARLPHKSTWIEFNLRKEREQFYKIIGNHLADPTETPQWEGWMLEQHPEVETAFSCSLFSFNVPEDTDMGGFDSWIFPFAYLWTTDDRTPPDGPRGTSFYRGIPQSFPPSSSLITGIPNYNIRQVTVGLNRFASFEKFSRVNKDTLTDLLQEWGGVVRRIWALLATINDIPVSHKTIVPSKGFVARGRYRQFLEHKVITLTVPEEKDLRKIARQAIAIARRRAHQVRGHWRKDWRHPGERIWIHEHQRGDASLGFVTHDYNVTH